jgi:hypothetical protein
MPVVSATQKAEEDHLNPGIQKQPGQYSDTHLKNKTSCFKGYILKGYFLAVRSSQ